MRHSTSLSLLSVLAIGTLSLSPSPLRGDEKPKDGTTKEGAGKEGAATTKAAEPVTCVALAKSWDQAIKDAKARNVPIVMHNHGFYCGPCWGMHASLMCDKGYIEFSYENAVEVLALDRLQEGVDKKEERAATYDAKEGSKRVKYLVEFPGLTIEDALALRNSKAASYNKSGGLPYTAIINPFTEEEMKSWKGGGIATSEVIEAVTTARQTLAKAHGKGKPRSEMKAIADGEAAGAAKVKAGDFAGALDVYAATSKKGEKDGWPAHLQDRIAKGREAAVAAATEALDKVEAAKATDAVQAKKDLVLLLPRLRGTGLEPRAKELLAGM